MKLRIFLSVLILGIFVCFIYIAFSTVEATENITILKAEYQTKKSHLVVEAESDYSNPKYLSLYVKHFGPMHFRKGKWSYDRRISGTPPTTVTVFSNQDGESTFPVEIN